MTGAALLFGCAAVVLTGGVLASSLRLPSPIAFVLGVSVLAIGEVVGLALLLSVGRWLTRDTLLVSMTALCAVAVTVWAARGRPLPPVGQATIRDLRDALRDPLVAVVTGVAASSIAYLGLVSVRTWAFDMDVLLYHLPRAALWKQQHAVGYVSDAPDERIGAMPPNAEIGSLFTMLLSGGDRYVGLVQVGALVVLWVATAGLALRFGLGRREALFGASLFVTFPVVALQAPTALTDLAVAALLASATYFFLGSGRSELVLAALAVGLALGTKFTAVLALPLVLAVALVGNPKQRWRGIGTAGFAGVVMGSAWYVLNLAKTGSIDGGLAEAFAQTPVRSVGATADRSYRLLVDLLDLPGSNIPGISVVDPLFTSALAVVLAVVAVRLARRGARVEATAVGLALVPLALAGPLVDRWDRVLRYGYESVRAGVGRASTPVFDTPGGFDAASSWYGPGLVAVLVAAAPLAWREVRRGRMRATALVALAGPFCFIAILALVVVYDPLRGRFLAFPVALATAAGAVVLQVRPLARVVVGLGIVTVSISLLSFNSVWGLDRWEAQSRKHRVAGDDPLAFRFFQTGIADDETIAVAVARDTYLHPLWDSRLQRTVRFVPPTGTVPDDAGTLVVGPGVEIPSCASDWPRTLATESGWTVLTRASSFCER